MKEIKKIDVMVAAKLNGLLSAVFGFIFGAILSLFSFIGTNVHNMKGGMFGIAYGAGAIIILPIFYAVFGYLAGLIGAAVYNVIAKKIGGFKIDLK